MIDRVDAIRPINEDRTALYERVFKHPRTETMTPIMRDIMVRRGKDSPHLADVARLLNKLDTNQPLTGSDAFSAMMAGICDFSHSSFKDAEFNTYVHFDYCDFTGTDMNGIKLISHRSVEFQSSDLSRALWDTVHIGGEALNLRETVHTLPEHNPFNSRVCPVDLGTCDFADSAFLGAVCNFQGLIIADANQPLFLFKFSGAPSAYAMQTIIEKSGATVAYEGMICAFDEVLTNWLKGIVKYHRDKPVLSAHPTIDLKYIVETLGENKFSVSNMRFLDPKLIPQCKQLRENFIMGAAPIETLQSTAQPHSIVAGGLSEIR